MHKNLITYFESFSKMSNYVGIFNMRPLEFEYTDGVIERMAVKLLSRIEGGQDGIEEHFPADLIEGLHQAVPITVGIVGKTR